MDYAEIKKLDEESARKMTEGSGPVDECICSLLAGAEKKSIGASIKKAFASIKPGTRRKSDAGQGGTNMAERDMPIVTVGPVPNIGNVPTGRRRAEPGSARRGNPGGRRGPPAGGRRGTAPAGGRRGADIVGKSGLDIPLVYNKGEKGIYTTKEVVKKKGSCGKCGCDKKDFVMKHSYANIRITSPDVSSVCPCPSNCLTEKSKFMNNVKVTIERMTIDPDSENSETSLHNHRQQISLKEPVMTDKKSVSSLINAQYDTDEDKLYD